MRVEACALEATKAVFELGGKAKFEDYDKQIKDRILFAPFIAGWGLSMSEKKRNDEKVSAFKACDFGWIRQIEGAYEITEEGIAMLANDT